MTILYPIILYLIYINIYIIIIISIKKIKINNKYILNLTLILVLLSYINNYNTIKDIEILILNGILIENNKRMIIKIILIFLFTIFTTLL